MRNPRSEPLTAVRIPALWTVWQWTEEARFGDHAADCLYLKSVSQSRMSEATARGCCATETTSWGFLGSGHLMVSKFGKARSNFMIGVYSMANLYKHLLRLCFLLFDCSGGLKKPTLHSQVPQAPQITDAESYSSYSDIDHYT
jgi:hypothetical protein